MKTALSLLLLCLLNFVSNANETKPSEEVEIRYCKAVAVYKMLGETFPEIDGIVILSLGLLLDREHPCSLENSSASRDARAPGPHRRHLPSCGGLITIRPCLPVLF